MCISVLSLICIYKISCVLSLGIPLSFPSFDNNIGNISEVECPEFEEISNGKVTIEKLGIIRRLAIISCDRGYDIEGSNSIYCEDGQWQLYKLPQCLKRCLPPPYLKNGALEIEGEKDDDGYYPKGTLASYSCGIGYELTPAASNLRVCEKGIWTGPIAICTPIIDQIFGCSIPVSIKNGYYTHEKVGMDEYKSFGEQIRYNCNSGYSLVGPRIQQCMDDGSWSPKIQPTCELKEDSIEDIPCDSLPFVPHGLTEIIQQPDRKSLAAVTVEIRCQGKYRNSASPCQSNKLKCQQGKWIGELPKCVLAHECYPPPPVPYTTIVDVTFDTYELSNPTKFPIKSKVTYQCLQGFILEGEPILTCSVGGCWSPDEPPMCIRTGGNFFWEVNNINAILISSATGACVLGILLIICLVVACRRKKRHCTTVAIPPPLPRQDLGDHAALLDHPDRLAFIAFADGVPRSQNVLPSYDEATRNERTNGVTVNRLHRPHWPNLAGRRTRNSPNPDMVHVTRHGSFASHTPSTRSAGDSMGSTDTMAISEGSTNVTLDTASSHSGSQPASCRAHCGSLASFDACSVINTEDVPLLEESEFEEIQGGTNDMENPVISENSSLKISTNSADRISA